MSILAQLNRKSAKQIASWLVVALLIASSGCKAKPDTTARPATTAMSSPGVMPSIPNVATLPGSKVRLLDGSCAGGRELGDLAAYSIQLRASQNSLGFIRVRREAIWTAEDMSNVLGTVPCGTLLWGQGPLKNSDYSMGIGYAVAVRDSQGKECRGYVSSTVVEEVAAK